jgi:hypothetical protein
MMEREIGQNEDSNNPREKFAVVDIGGISEVFRHLSVEPP